MHAPLCCAIPLPGDFKQLPPATSQAPFIRLDSVHNFLNFRVLRQNRRVVKGDTDSSAQRKAEIEHFHGDALRRLGLGGISVM